jgi:hypothetical protein
MIKFLTQLLNLIYKRRCYFCGNAKENSLMCSKCYEKEILLPPKIITRQEGVPFYSVETITSDVPPKFISPEEHQKLIKRCEPKFGDILLTRIGTLAKSKIVDWSDEFSIYVSLALLSSIKINNGFRSKMYKEVKDKISGGTYLGISYHYNNNINNKLFLKSKYNISFDFNKVRK